MKKLVLIFTLSVLLLSVAWAQIVAWEFDGNAGTEVTVNATTNNANLNTSVISRGAGLTTSSLGNAFSATNYSANGTKADAISNNKYFQFSISAKSGYKVSLSTLDAIFRRSSTGPNAFQWQYSLDGFATSGIDFGSSISYTSTATNGTKQTQISLSSISALQDVASGTTITIRLYGWGASQTGGTFALGRLAGNDLAIGGTVAATGANPTISVTPGALSGFTYVHGSGPSTEKTFTISGSNLTANISITAPTNYEISKTSGSGYASPLTLTQSGGSVAITTIYVRLKAGLGVGNYNNETITASSSGADSKTVTCSGSVTTPDPPSAPVASEASDIEATKFTANWNSASGASGYKLDVYTKTSSGNASDLFISEYIEGSTGNNKAIEIYNGTGVSVDLSNYTLQKQTNGAGAFGGNFALSGTLASGSVHIVAHSGADAAIKDLADQITGGSPLDFNGNDCVALYKNGVMIDLVGVLDQISPDWGANMTLVRKENATVPNTTYSVSDWDSHTPETTDYLGSHTFAGGVTKDYVTGYNNLDVSNNLSKQVTGLNPDTTYYYVVRAYDSYSQTSGNSNEIEVSTTQAYDYPDGEEIDAGDVLIEIVGGNGNIVDRPLTNVPNPTFVATFEQAIELFDVDDDNYWLISIFAPYDQWGACLVDNAWISETVDEDGYLLFEIDLSEAKGTIIEIKTGNGGNPTLPVELSSFTATMHAQNYVQLTWITQTETGVLGYYIYRSSENVLSSALKISDMIAATNTSQTQCYVYVDKELNENGTHYYWLENVDFDGSHQYHGPVFIEYYATDINPSPVPLITRINSVYPNPFNPSTRIPFELAKAADVKIEIYNTRGQLVKSYPVQSKDMGNHYVEWDGSSDRGEACATGVYYIKMHTGNKTYSTKAVMIK